jgi:hypothetical protein
MWYAISDLMRLYCIPCLFSKQVPHTVLLAELFETVTKSLCNHVAG